MTVMLTYSKQAHIQIKDMYRTFFAPQLVSEREDWSNLSQDTCYIAPDEESQGRATEDERKKQAPEDEKNAVERHAHKDKTACSLVCEAEGLNLSVEEYEALETEQRGELVRKRYKEQSSKSRHWDEGRNCFQWRYRNGVCCTAKSSVPANLCQNCSDRSVPRVK